MPDNYIDLEELSLYLAIQKLFRKYRFDSNHHLGLGDIRLGIGQQEEILELIAKHTGVEYTGV